MVVNLDFATKIDTEFLSAGVSVQLTRLIGTIQFQTSNGWSIERQAIIDTGSPVSVLPQFVWKDIEVKWLLSQKQKLFGIGEGGVSGRLGEVTGIFSDEDQFSFPISFKAHLLDDNNVPLLIGYEDILTSLKLVSDYKNKSAFLRWE